VNSLLNIDRICVDPLDGLPLLCDHARELTEDGSELGDSGLDGLDGGRSGSDVVVLGRARESDVSNGLFGLSTGGKDSRARPKLEREEKPSNSPAPPSSASA
jgi:hypothetical protein